MTDPHNFDRRMELERRMGFASRTNDSLWAWAAGGIALVVVLVLVFTPSEPTQTARTDPVNPPATTGVTPTPRLTTPPQMPDAPSTTGEANR